VVGDGRLVEVFLVQQLDGIGVSFLDDLALNTGKDVRQLIQSLKIHQGHSRDI